MPIQTAVPVQVFDQESFHQVDKRVTGIAFDIHNDDKFAGSVADGQRLCRSRKAHWSSSDIFDRTR